MSILGPKLVDGKYLIPVFKCRGIYAVWRGNDRVWYFNSENLPDCIKAKLEIISNSPHASDLDNKDMTNMDITRGQLYIDVFKMGVFGEEYKDIGWQYNKFYYIVILEPEEYRDMIEE